MIITRMLALAILTLAGGLCVFFSLSTLDHAYYLGARFPYLLAFLLPFFLLGQRHASQALRWALTVSAISSASVIYWLRAVHPAGAMRTRGWASDLWILALGLALLIAVAVEAGRLASRLPPVRRWLATIAVAFVLVGASIGQVLSFLGPLRHEVTGGRDFQNLPYEAAIHEFAAFVIRHYGYLEYKGIDWASRTRLAAREASRAQSDVEFSRIVVGLINELGDGHLRPQAPALAEPPGRAVAAGVTVRPIEGQWVITHVLRGSPAESAGVKVGQELRAIDGIPPQVLAARLPDWRSNAKPGTPRAERHAAALALAGALRGPRGTVLRLNLIDDRRHDLHVVLDRIAPQPPFIESRRLGDVGYVHISRFPPPIADAVARFDRVLEEHWHARALIIDVRNNSGGLGFLPDLFLGRLCEVRIRYAGHRSPSTGGIRWSWIVPRGPRYPRPVVVLADESTVSAGELFAFAARAIPGVTLVGRRTFGQVSSPSQQLIRLPAGVRLPFYFASLVDQGGRLAVEWHGVTPDVEVPLRVDSLRRGTDDILATALGLLR